MTIQELYEQSPKHPDRPPMYRWPEGDWLIKSNQHLGRIRVISVNRHVVTNEIMNYQPWFGNGYDGNTSRCMKVHADCEVVKA